MDLNRKILYFNSVDSTNEVAKRSELEEAVFIAREQTAGKGSKGRSWQSNKDEGLYLSFLLRPKIEPEKVQGLTLAAAVAVCRAIEKNTLEKAKIKWPNDVLVDGKKAAGILTESILGSSGIERVVCGIGININQKFDDELVNKAKSVDIVNGKEKLLDDITKEFFEAYDVFLEDGLAPFMKEFKKRNALEGKLHIVSGRETSEGIFKDFDETGAVLIETEDGIKRFIAGEISIRGENGYA